MNLHLGILPSAQREFWDTDARHVPAHFVLYGGTAVALRFGHRQSVDFDFFTDREFRLDDLWKTMPTITQATVLQRAENTVLVSTPGEVKLSFFGGLSFGRIGDPDKSPDRPQSQLQSICWPRSSRPCTIAWKPKTTSTSKFC